MGRREDSLHKRMWESDFCSVDSSIACGLEDCEERREIRVEDNAIDGFVPFQCQFPYLHTCDRSHTLTESIFEYSERTSAGPWGEGEVEKVEVGLRMYLRPTMTSETICRVRIEWVEVGKKV